jgi:hypothetical protein
MRILADENVAGEIVETLRQRGHAVAWSVGMHPAPAIGMSSVARQTISE